MTKTSRIRRALAAVVGLALAGSLTAAADAGPASAADDHHLTSAVLLSAHDVARAGWDDPTAFTLITPDGLLAQCGIELPYWSPGFRELQRRGFQMSPPYRSGAELVMAFATADEARDYVTNYGFGVDLVCSDVFGEKRWDVRSSAPLKLRHKAEHAHTWNVRDTSGRSQSVSITLVRVHERVEILWLTGDGQDDPVRSIDLRQVVQRATDRMEA